MARNNNVELELNLGDDSSSESSCVDDSPTYSPTGSPIPNLDDLLAQAGEISSSAPSSTTDEEPATPTYSPPDSPVPTFDDDFVLSLCSSNSTTYSECSNVGILDYRTHVLQQLSNVGYHRARVSTVSDYDKAIGGISWIISRFDKREKREKRPVKSWCFQDEFRETGSKPKTHSELMEECEVVIKGLLLMKCDICVPMSSLLQVDFFVINRILNWLIPKLNNLEGSGHFFKYYQYVLLSQPKDEDEVERGPPKPTLVTMFRRALYMPNKMRLAQAKHCDMFDYSIVLDSNVTPKQILAEYITYSRTGVRTYPLVFDKLLHEDLTSDETNPFDLTPNVYQVLEELANNIFENYDDAALDALDTAYRSLRTNRFGKRLRTMHMRCVEEFHKLNTLQKSFGELQAIYEKTQAEIYDITPFMVAAKLTNLINFTRERGAHVVQMMIFDYEDAHDRIQRIQARGYCPFGREECDKLRATAQTTLTNLNDLRRRHKTLERDLKLFDSSLKDFNSAHEKPITKYVPMQETFVDQIMCGELGLWAQRVVTCSKRVETNELSKNDPAIEELRNQYLAFMVDARICVADLERKSYLLKKRRIQMSQQLEKLHGDLFTEQLKAVAYDKVLENLRRLNAGISEYRELVTEAERASPRFAANAFPPPRPVK